MGAEVGGGSIRSSCSKGSRVETLVIKLVIKPVLVIKPISIKLWK